MDLLVDVSDTLIALLQRQSVLEAVRVEKRLIETRASRTGTVPQKSVSSLPVLELKRPLARLITSRLLTAHLLQCPVYASLGLWRCACRLLDFADPETVLKRQRCSQGKSTKWPARPMIP